MPLKNRFLLVLSYVFGIGLVILFLMYVWRRIKDFPLALVIILGLGAGIIALVGFVLAGIALLLKWLYQCFRHKPLVTAMATIGVIILLFSLGAYYFKTVEYELPKKALNIQNVRFYHERGLIFTVDYFQYEVYPSMAKADTVYEITAENGLVKFTDKVIWSELELGLDKPKVIKHKISADEYSGLSQNPINISIASVLPERNVLYLFIPIIYVCVVVLILMRYNRKPNIVEGEFQELMQ